MPCARARVCSGFSQVLGFWWNPAGALEGVARGGPAVIDALHAHGPKISGVPINYRNFSLHQC